jgi:hypothetical protein
LQRHGRGRKQPPDAGESLTAVPLKQQLLSLTSLSQVIASRVKKAIAAEAALGGNAADIGSDGRRR